MKFVLSLLVVPLLAQQSLSPSSVEKEFVLGQHVAAEIRQQAKPLAHPAAEAYVRRIGAELVGQLKDASVNYQFEVIVDNFRTEPFSLPGGYVMIPARAFVAAQDEAEFVGMLAHSMGHIALRHGMRMSNHGQMAGVASVPIVFMGGRTGSHADSRQPQMTVPMSFLQFQRAHELEADRFALTLTARSGYDAAAFASYIERMQSSDSATSPLPARDLRLTKLQETLSSLPAATRSSSADEFPRVQEAVRSTLERPHPQRVPTLRR